MGEESGEGRFVIQMELTFGGALNADRLIAALDLMLDAEPILGCRFVEHPKLPYWERLPEAARKNFILAKDEQEYYNFRNSGQDSCKGPQLQACLWRKSSGDSLILKICHEVADAGGVKDIVAKLSAIYNRLGKEPDFKPDPNVSGCRDYGQILKYIPFYAYPVIFFNWMRQNWSTNIPAQTHILKLPEGPVEPLTYVIKHIPAERTEKIAQFGKARNATINDLLIAAHYWALVKEAPWDGKSALRFLTTLNLRHWYLPDEKTEGICNLSIFEHPDLGSKLGKNFEETLDLVSGYTRERKKHWRCLSDLSLFALLKLFSYENMKKAGIKFADTLRKRGTFPNGLTNVGVIQPEKVNFGMEPLTAWMLVPFMFPPFFITGLSGYKGSLTLSAGIPMNEREIIDNFCESIIGFLPA